MGWERNSAISTDLINNTKGKLQRLFLEFLFLKFSCNDGFVNCNWFDTR
jgi:hypothetical protein